MTTEDTSVLLRRVPAVQLHLSAVVVWKVDRLTDAFSVHQVERLKLRYRVRAPFLRRADALCTTITAAVLLYDVSVRVYSKT